jgi:membrane fusion protein, heavy metal efflux system
MKNINQTVLLLIGGLLWLVLGTGCLERFNQNQDTSATADETATASAPVSSAAGDVTADSGAEQAAPTPADGGGEEEVALIQFTPEQLKQHGVKVLVAGAGQVEQYLTLPGEVAVNADKVAHVLPRMAGVIQRLTKNIGDTVHQGELLAVIDSRELAEAKSAYLTVVEEVKIAQSNVDREQQLFEKGVSAEQDYINAKNELRQAQIQQQAAEQVLSALGVSAKQVAALTSAPNALLTRYEVYAPSNGRILEKHVSTGAMVSSETEMYLIADLSSVWVNLSVNQKDLPKVKEGQHVRIRFNPNTDADANQPAAETGGGGIPDAQAKVKYIDALVSEDTRAATARVVLPNPAGQWRPGMFVSGQVTTGNAQAAVVVPVTAIIPYEGQPTVFVATADGFEPRAVTLGRQSATLAEVLSGLKAGESFVSQGAFMVKADLGKSEAMDEE